MGSWVLDARMPENEGDYHNAEVKELLLVFPSTLLSAVHLYHMLGFFLGLFCLFLALPVLAESFDSYSAFSCSRHVVLVALFQDLVHLGPSSCPFSLPDLSPTWRSTLFPRPRCTGCLLPSDRASLGPLLFAPVSLFPMGRSPARLTRRFFTSSAPVFTAPVLQILLRHPVACALWPASNPLPLLSLMISIALLASPHSLMCARGTLVRASTWPPPLRTGHQRSCKVLLLAFPLHLITLPFTFQLEHPPPPHHPL